MLVFNIRRVMKARDIDRPYRFLIENGFTHMTATALARGNILAPKVAHVERLCRLLHCTPNDFYEWKPKTDEQPITENHPLNTLNRAPRAGLSNLLKEVPLEKLSELEEVIKRMKDN